MPNVIKTLAVFTLSISFLQVSQAEELKSSSELEGWGRYLDPDGDCTARESDGQVFITIPKGWHDMWYGKKNPDKRYNSPRFLQAVEGDFIAQAKVTGDWKLGENPLSDKSNACAAGLLVWESNKHYFRHERNRYISSRQPGVPRSWVPPLYDRNEKRQTTWKSVRYEYFRDRFTWLRIERNGQTLSTSISHDGKEWFKTAEVPTEFPSTVQVGFHGTNSTENEVTYKFEDFQITSK